ncbi:MAG: hypothetical protein LBT70_04040 [Holosporaceae bacterium]|nr:hypothetical protein [Holosporaceae bacterium]
MVARSSPGNHEQAIEQFKKERNARAQLEKLVEQQQSTIDQQREQTGKLNADLAARQLANAQLQAENTILRNQLGISKNMSAEEVRCHIFRHRLIGLLVRAKDGYDYRIPLNHEEYMKRFTVSNAARGTWKTQHGFSQKAWKTVESDISQCLEQLGKVRPLSRETPSDWKNIADKIQNMNELLPFDSFQKRISDTDKEFYARKIKIARTLEKALETIQAYMIKNSELPEDPYEIIGDDGKPQTVTQQEMEDALRKAAKVKTKNSSNTTAKPSDDNAAATDSGSPVENDEPFGPPESVKIKPSDQ